MEGKGKGKRLNFPKQLLDNQEAPHSLMVPDIFLEKDGHDNCTLVSIYTNKQEYIHDSACTFLQ